MTTARSIQGVIGRASISAIMRLLVPLLLLGPILVSLSTAATVWTFPSS